MHYTEVSITRVFATGRVFARKYSILVKLTMYKYATPQTVLYIYARCEMGRRVAQKTCGMVWGRRGVCGAFLII